MVAAVLLLIIIILSFSLLYQRRRLKRSESYMKDQTQKKQKPKSQRVPYLEPKLRAENTRVEESVSDNLTAEDADEVLGLTQETPSAVQKQAEGASQKSCLHESAPNSSASESHLIVLYLKSPADSPYSGYELLQALLSAGLRYGEQQVFHRYESKTARGNVLFSVSSAVEPATFDLPRMGGFSTPALCLYFDLNQVSEPMQVFEMLLHTAGQLSEDLGGKVLDSSRALLTKEMVREICLRIHRLEKQVNNFDLFADNAVE